MNAKESSKSNTGNHRFPPGEEGQVQEAVLEHWSVPGSLLIAGEYRITEKDGRALSLAAGPRARMSVYTSRSYIFEGQWTGSTVRWEPDKPSQNASSPPHSSEHQKDSPAEAVWKETEQGAGAAIPSSPRRLKVDTGDFFNPDGSKRGYGSSAAATVLYTAGLGIGSGPNDLERMALNAHRSFQGGRGSGYDVLTSFHGGAGLIRGGIQPVWTPLAWPLDLNAWIFKGPSPVRTVSAVSRYEAWRKEQPEEHRQFADTSDTLVLNLADTLNESRLNDASFGQTVFIRFIETLCELARLSVNLGDAIGVPSRPRLPETFASDIRNNQRPGVATKCLGAGDELTLLCAEPSALTKKELATLESLVRMGRAELLCPEQTGLQREHF